MARYELKMPSMGESVAEATITAWFKKVGDTVEIDESIVEVATDKVDSEIPSEVDGVLVEILHQVEEVVQIGEVIAIIETKEPEKEIITENLPGTELLDANEQEETISENDIDDGFPPELAKFYSPLVRSIAKKEGVTLQELNKILGTGADHRVTKEDILMYIETRNALENVEKQENVASPEIINEPQTESAFNQSKETTAVPTTTEPIKSIIEEPIKVQEVSNIEKKTEQENNIRTETSSPIEPPIPPIEKVAEKQLFQKEITKEIDTKPILTSEEIDTTQIFNNVNVSTTSEERTDNVSTTKETPITPIEKGIDEETKSEALPTPEKTEVTKQTSAHKIASISIKPGDEVIEMSRMGKIIAEHMIMSKQTSAHVQSFTEADVTHIWNWRNKVKKDFEAREGEKFTFTPIFLEAVVHALKEYPMMNVSVDGTNIIKKKDINIGMATALPDGNLIVPVIKRADDLNLRGMAKTVNDLATRARANKLKPDEVKDGTYTVTNIGSFGNIFGTPIINQPQVGILAIGAIRKVPSVIETPDGDMIGIRYKMMLSHSYDHRVVNGALGGLFVQCVAQYLEQWDINREL